MTINVIPLRIDLPCDVEPSPENACHPSAPATPNDKHGSARKCADLPSPAQQEARWDAWIKYQLEIYKRADEGMRNEVDAMCERIRARRNAGIPDPIERRPSDAQWDYQTEREAGWCWR